MASSSVDSQTESPEAEAAMAEVRAAAADSRAESLQEARFDWEVADVTSNMGEEAKLFASLPKSMQRAVHLGGVWRWVWGFGHFIVSVQEA